MDDYELLGCLEITSNSAATVAPTVVDLVALLLRCADTTGTATVGRAAALRLALVVLKHKEFALIQISFGAQQRLVRSRSAPRIRL